MRNKCKEKKKKKRRNFGSRFPSKVNCSQEQRSSSGRVGPHHKPEEHGPRSWRFARYKTGAAEFSPPTNFPHLDGNHRQPVHKHRTSPAVPRKPSSSAISPHGKSPLLVIELSDFEPMRKSLTVLTDGTRRRAPTHPSPHHSTQRPNPHIAYLCAISMHNRSLILYRSWENNQTV